MTTREAAGLPFLEVTGGGTRLRVRVQPRSSRVGVRGMQGNEVKVGIGAAPVDGGANEELRRCIAGIFRVSFSAVSIEHGEKSRSKTLFVSGCTDTSALEALLASAKS